MADTFLDVVDVGVRHMQNPAFDSMDLIADTATITTLVMKRHYPELNEPASEGLYEVTSPQGKAIEAVVQDRLTALPAYAKHDEGEAARNLDALKEAIGPLRMQSVLRDIDRCVDAHAKDAGLAESRNR